MKDYKLLLVGLMALILIIIISVFTWLWTSNRKNANPLPILVSQTEHATTHSEDQVTTAPASMVHIQVEDTLQVPLNDMIGRFEARYPTVKVQARYVPPSSVLTLPALSASNQESLSVIRNSVISNIDIIIADDKITQSRLSPLQRQLNNAQTQINQSSQQPINIDPTMDADNTQVRRLASFSYAIKDSQTVDGVILTDNPTAISFRNFLLSSTGQDILKQHGYHDIDGYKNSVDDLFNPASSHKRASGQSSVKLADALSNGQ